MHVSVVSFRPETFSRQILIPKETIFEKLLNFICHKIGFSSKLGIFKLEK